MRNRHQCLASILTCVALVSVIGCGQEKLRGRSVPSTDGQTHLVLEDDNGGDCGTIKVDGRVWPHPTHVAGPISAGKHEIECGDAGRIEFEIESGTTFHFDYWGP